MSDPLADRMLPHNIDAERGVIGGVLRDPEVLSDVQSLLKADHFYLDAHRKLFAAITDLAAENQPFDLVLVRDRLVRKKQFDDAGGVPYLTQLWDAVPTGANAEYHAKIVRETAMVRSLIHASHDIARDSFDNVASADELVAQAERKIMDIAQTGLVSRTSTIGAALQQAFTQLDDRIGKGGIATSGLSTGYIDLDSMTAGLHRSELVVVGARPSVGKTNFSLNLVRNIITNSRDLSPVVVFFSLEMPQVQLAERLLCCHALVDSHHMRTGRLAADEIQKLLDAGDELRRHRLYIDDTPSRSVIQIAATCRRIARKHHHDGGLSLVVIDYLQLIEPENRRDPRQEQVAQISRRLKILAKELNVPVIALAQVNRAAEDRQDHRPRLSDLRESGAIEADADTVMLLHRPGMYDREDEAAGRILEVLIAKQRNGPTDDVTLTCLKEFNRYENHIADAAWRGE